MEIGNTLNTGLQGFQNATNRANEAAQEIASQSVSDSTQKGVNTSDLATSLVDLKTAQVDAEANAKVIKSASDMIGSLLDVTV